MKFAYADPPYVGMANKYPERTEVDHAELIDRLCREYDGWALSLSVPSLRVILPVTPPPARICAWVKPFASFKPSVRIAYAWEPVILWGGRPRTREQVTVRDWIATPIALRKGLFGAKPDAFCRWVLDLLNYQDGDELVDLYPGTGSMTAAAAQTRLFAV